ncbi:MAG: MerR family transcriptional regulator [Chlorobi bacterium]|nr:MerR family transcriptional regulator [Chlorobiota bacterium]
MDTKNLIPIDQLCGVYEIPKSFIDALCNYELVEVVDMNEEQYIPQDHIKDIEKMMRLHFDLDINYEGLDVVMHLLERIDELEKEVNYLKNKLSIYESEF